MMTQNVDKEREQIQLFCMGDMVPQGHLLQIVNEAIDQSFTYELAEDKYSRDNGRPNMDPVMLIKIFFIQYLYGIKSMCQTVKEIGTNVAYCWFLGLDMLDRVSYFSTLGKDCTRCFKDTDLFEQISAHILSKCYKLKLIDPNEAFMDATHIKARTNNEEMQKHIAHDEVLFLEDPPRQKINEDREAHGKRPLKKKGSDNNIPSSGTGGKEEKTVRVSASNPENGRFHKGEYKHVSAYAIQTVCDKNGWTLNYSVHPGNNHDSRIFKSLHDKIKGIEIKTLIADAGHETPGIAKLLIDQGVEPLLPYKRLLTREGLFRKYGYVYDECHDCYICLNDQVLTYRTTNREGYREHKSCGSACVSCAHLTECT